MSENETTGTAERTIDAPATEVAGLKVIKRYTNRKLYDTVESRYVTLEEIAEMVKAGAEVKIVDNRSKEDLTSVTLAQIIFEEEKRQNHMPLGVLRRIIQTGGVAVSDFFNEQASRVGQLRDEAENRVGRLFKRDDGTTYRGVNVKELFTGSTRTLDEWQRRVDERVRSAVETVTGIPHVYGEVQRLTERLERIEQKLSKLDDV